MSEDLISREEVLRAIITAGEVEPDLGYTHLHKVIENLPSAKASQNLAEPIKVLKGSDLISRRDAIECCSCLHPEDCWAEIKALPSATSQNLAKPHKTCEDDLIRRQDVIDALGEEPPVWYDGDDEIAERNQWRRDKAAIESLPSAEPKTGEWIFNPKDAIELMFMKPKCSKCGFESSDGGNFCPNCGARMEGEEE